MSDHIRIGVQQDCTNRLPKLKYDQHSKCSECLGKLCQVDNRCEECASWTEEFMFSYLRHRKKLMQDRARKARIRLEKGNQDGSSRNSSSSTLSVFPLSSENISLLSEKKS